MDTWRQNVAWLEIVSYAMQSAWILSRLWLSKLHGSALPRIDSSRNEKRLVRVDSVMRGWTEGDKNLSNLSYRLSFFQTAPRFQEEKSTRVQNQTKHRHSLNIWTAFVARVCSLDFIQAVTRPNVCNLVSAARGLQLMAPGESRRFWIPAELAFGTNETAQGSAWLSNIQSMQSLRPIETSHECAFCNLVCLCWNAQ
jgi:hypothetical protein